MHVKFSLSRWQLTAWLIGLLLVTPLGFLLFESLQGDSDVFQHLFDTVLWDYTRNTLILIAGVGLLSCIIALPLAWLTAYCDFPGRKQFEWALMLPLAMPTYLIAYVYTDLLDYAGPVQIALRDWFGWQSPDDYWFFDIRTLTGAIFMIALVLYPYLYLIFKTALREQSFKLVQASQLMGLSPLQSFLRVSLPLGRGAIVAGITLISMEAMADFATVNYFAVSTLTTAVYDTWLGYYSLTAAAKISGIMLLILFLTIMVERFSRRNQAVYERQSSVNSATLYRLKGGAAWAASLACTVVLVLAFILPVGVLVKYAIVYADEAWNGAFFNYAWQSFKVAVVVSIATGGWGETAKAKLKSAGFDISGLPMASSCDHYRRTEIMKIAGTRATNNAHESLTYFGDAQWDINACTGLAVNLVIVGDRVEYHQSISDFSDVDQALAYI